MSAATLAAAGVEADVEKAERAWAAGIMKNDFASLEKVLADDLTYRHSNGAIDTKRSYIDNLKAGKSRYFTAELSEVTVKVIDEKTALAFSKGLYITLSATGTKQEMTLMTLHVFRKNAQGWQMVAHQSARMPQP